MTELEMLERMEKQLRAMLGQVVQRRKELAGELPAQPGPHANVTPAPVVLMRTQTVVE
jgi:hypothetical protein